MTSSFSETVLTLGTAAILLLPAIPPTATVARRGRDTTGTSFVEEVAIPGQPSASTTVLTGQARIDKLNELCGKYRDILPSSEEFNRTKHLDW